MRCSGKLESKNLKQTSASFPRRYGRAHRETASCYGQTFSCPGIPASHGVKASPDVVRESQLVMYCKVLQSYTGYIVWLWYMWFPFSEFGMVIHCHRGEWVGGEGEGRSLSFPTSPPGNSFLHSHHCCRSYQSHLRTKNSCF